MAEGTIAEGATRLPPQFGPHPREKFRRLAWFVAVGAISTAAFAVLYALARTVVGPLVANLAALSLTMLFNFTANRYYTFRATQGPWPLQGAQYLVVYILGLGVSSAVLLVSLQVVSEPPRTVETLMAVAAGAGATVIRFVLLSKWVFHHDPANAGDSLPLP